MQEINAVKAEVDERTIQIVGLRLERCCPGFIQAINHQIAVDEVGVSVSACGIEFQRLLGGGEAFIVIAERAVDDAQTTGRNVVAGVGLSPEFAGLAGGLEISGDVILIVRSDVELFALAHTLPTFVGLAGILGGAGGLAEVAVAGSKACIRHGKIGIETDGALE